MKRFVVLCAVFVLAGIGHVQGTIYNARQDFSEVNNPNGTWTYGYRVNVADPLVPFSCYDHTPRDVGDPIDPNSAKMWHDRSYVFCHAPNAGLIPEEYQNTEGFVAGPDDMSFHPAPGTWYRGAELDWCVIRWTAPSEGIGDLYVKYGGVFGEETGLRDVYVYKNSGQLYETTLVGTETATYTKDSIAFDRGDYIDFAVGPHDTWGADWTSVAAIIEFNAILPVLGDLDDDGYVGGHDLDIVRVWWGYEVTPGELVLGDPSGDGFVGGDDLDIVRANWGQGTPPVPRAIPEPGSITLILCGVIASLICWRRWK